MLSGPHRAREYGDVNPGTPEMAPLGLLNLRVDHTVIFSVLFKPIRRVLYSGRVLLKALDLCTAPAPRKKKKKVLVLVLVLVLVSKSRKG